jgi:hypothetical protein
MRRASVEEKNVSPQMDTWSAHLRGADEMSDLIMAEGANHRALSVELASSKPSAGRSTRDHSIAPPSFRLLEIVTGT